MGKCFANSKSELGRMKIKTHIREKKTSLLWKGETENRKKKIVTAWMDRAKRNNGSNNVNLLLHRFSCRQTRDVKNRKVERFSSFYVITFRLLTLFFSVSSARLFFFVVSFLFLFWDFYFRCSLCAFPLVILLVFAVSMSRDFPWEWSLLLYIHRTFTLPLNTAAKENGYLAVQTIIKLLLKKKIVHSLLQTCLLFW